MLYCIVRNRKVEVKQPTYMVRNGIESDVLRLEMDDEWAAMDSITVVFWNSAQPEEKAKPMLFTFGQTVEVPWEVLTDTGRLYLSCTGIKGTQVLRTAKATTYWEIIQEGIKDGEAPTPPPTPDILDQIKAVVEDAQAAGAEARKAAKDLLEAAIRGEFDGKPGPVGPIGPTGQQGPIGPVGPRGPQGNNGTDGKDGVDGKDGSEPAVATCYDEADPVSTAPNIWYVPKDMPRPSGKIGMMVDVQWINGKADGIGYDVQLIWGAPDGADNEIIVEQTNTSNSLTGEYSIPTEGTVRYQLVEANGRKHWRYVSGPLLPRQFSTDTDAATADKAIHGMALAYLPGMEVYVTLDQGNTADLMRLVPDEGPTLPVYVNGRGATTGEIPAGYICHLINAGDHWIMDNLGGGGGDLFVAKVWFSPKTGRYATNVIVDDVLDAVNAGKTVVAKLESEYAGTLENYYPFIEYRYRTGASPNITFGYSDDKGIHTLNMYMMGETPFDTQIRKKDTPIASGVDQTYVDQQDQQMLQAAKDYSDSKLVTIEIEDRGGNNFWTRPVTTANQIIDMVNAGKEVRLSFFDTITNTGDQLYPYENTRQSVCYFRRNIITEDKISRVSWGVQFDGSIVAQEIVPALATNATEKVNETLADITSLDSFYTHFYGLRKSPVRRYQFEYTQNGIHQNIADAIGLPAEYPVADKGFLYVDLPYSEAGGFMIVVTLEGRTNGQLWKQSHWATLNSTWHKSEWVDQTKQPSGSGVQSDWNQNDPSKPDFIKNRVCYERADGIVKTIESRFIPGATGENTEATGAASHAEGSGTTTIGRYSHAECLGESHKFERVTVSNTRVDEKRFDVDAAIAKIKLPYMAVLYQDGAEKASVLVKEIKPKGSTFTIVGYTRPTGLVDGIYTMNIVKGVAMKEAAHAEGTKTIANARHAHTEGDKTIVTGAIAKDGTVIGDGVAGHAEGTETMVTGNSAHAEGFRTTAVDKYSHAEGYSTTASGQSSHAEGNNTTASGQSSHAEGSNTTASGDYSHAESNNTTASGDYSHAEGSNTTASGVDGSHAEGSGTTASGKYSSHAEGWHTTASGNSGSHAEGSSTTASGDASHAEGGLWTSDANAQIQPREYTDPSGTKHTIVSTTAMGVQSHAEGSQTVAYGYSSHAEGYVTTASGEASHASGKYNDPGTADKPYLFSVGNGTSDTDRKNAMDLDYEGNMQLGKGLIIKSPTGKKFRLIVDDSGALSTEPVV